MKKYLMAAAYLLCAAMFLSVPQAGTAENVSGAGWYLEGSTLHITGNIYDAHLASSTSSNWTTNKFESWEHASEVETIVVEEGVTVLGGFSFYGLRSASSVSLPSTLQEIHGEAFYNCYSITEITIPASVQSIGPYAFTGCQNLKKVVFEGAPPRVGGYSYWHDYNSTAAPFSNSGIDFYYSSDYAWDWIAMSSFSTYGTWHDTNILDSGTTGDTAFWTYNKHHVLTVSGTGTAGRYNSGSITPWAQYNKEIEQIIVQDGITEILSYTFEYITHLKSVSLPKTLTSLACSAFNDCRELPAITIPYSVQSFAYGTFSRCDALKHIYYMGTEEEWQEIANYQYCEVYGAEDVSYHFLTYFDELAPTCGQDGRNAYFRNDSEESPVFYGPDRKPIAAAPILPALGHDWGEIEYIWSEDHSSVTARRVCLRDETHIESETVAAAGEVISQPDCTTPGKTAYASEAFENPLFTAQEITLAEPQALGHDWSNPVYLWSEDNSTVTAQRVCGHDETHVEEETVEVNVQIIQPSTCDEPGIGTYSAAFENPAFKTQIMAGEEIPALGHDWEDVVYEWSDHDTQITARRVCRNDPTHIEAETVALQSAVTVPPTCTEGGQTTLTGTPFANPAFVAQIKVVDVKPALGHDPVTDSAVSPTCDEPGFTEGSHCSVCGLVFQAQEELPALGHIWEEPVYSWDRNRTTVTAVAHCARDQDHILEETVTTTRTLQRAPTADSTGICTVAAVFEHSGVFSSQQRSVSIPALDTLSVLRLPAGLTSIEAQAFEGAACQAVILPEGCQEIGAQAFAHCEQLLYVFIPDSVSVIAPDAFEGSAQVTLSRKP